MNEPIINPIFIYLIELCSNLGFLTIMFSIILLFTSIVLIATFLHWKYDEYNTPDEEDVKERLSLLKKFVIVTGVCIGLSVFVPSEDTMYKMFVSSYITQENLNTAGETITDAVDYIFEKVEQLQED